MCKIPKKVCKLFSNTFLYVKVSVIESHTIGSAYTTEE